MSACSRSSITAAAIVAASALLLGLGGCGSSDGGDEAATTSSSSTASSAESATPPRQKEKQGADASAGHPQPPPRQAERDAVGPTKEGSAKEFETPGGDNSIQRFGSESQAGELAQVEATLRDYLEARTAGDWDRMCAQLSTAARSAITAYAGAAPAVQGEPAKDCAEVAPSVFPQVSPDLARALAVVGTAALRVHGSDGFLLFRGAGGARYFIRVSEEGGRWRLGAPAPSELP